MYPAQAREGQSMQPLRTRNDVRFMPRMGRDGIGMIATTYGQRSALHIVGSK